MIIGEDRNFLYNGNIFYIKSPTTEDIRGADWTYSKVYTKSLTEGIATSAEMVDILKMRGVVGPEYDQRSKELTQNLNALIYELSLAPDNESKRELAIRVAEARDDLYRWNQRLRSPMSHTCEQIADDARLEYLTSCIVCDSNKNKVWKDYNSYLTEKDNNLSLRARVEVMLFLQGIDSDFMDKTPEAEAIREIEDEEIAAAEALIKTQEAMEIEEAALHASDKVDNQPAVTSEEDSQLETEVKSIKAPKIKKSKK